MSPFQITFLVFAPILALGLAALGGIIVDKFEFSSKAFTVAVLIWIAAAALFIWGFYLHVVCW